MASFRANFSNPGATMPMRGSNKSAAFLDLLYSLGMPSMSGRSIYQDDFMRRLNAGQIDIDALTKAHGGPAGGAADPAMGGMGGGMQRPRGGMMGFSPFRINTRYSNRGR